MGHVLKINRVSLLILVVFFERSLPLAVQKRGQLCDTPAIPQHAYIKPSNTQWFVGSTVTFLCQKGYFQQDIGSVSAVCKANGKWSATQVHCIARSCGGPKTPLNGKKQGLQYQLGDTVRFTCDKGYQLNGSSQRTCTLVNNTTRVEWSGTQPLCKPVSCGNVAKVAHGRTLVGMTTYQSKAFYTCNKGYELEGSSVMTCGEDGTWLGTEPSCKAIKCDDPGPLQNGFQEGSLNFSYGAEIRYMCKAGYVIFGSPTRTCSKEGRWTGVKPFCVECAKVGTAVLIRKGINFLPAIVLEKRLFVVTVQRQDTGEQEEVLTLGPGTQHYAIVEDKTPTPHDVINGSKVIAMNFKKGVHMFATATKHIENDTTVFRVLFADNTTAFVALESLRTLDQPIFCALCDAPVIPDHAIRQGDLREYISGMAVTYTCEYTYRMTGSKRRTCLPDGEWSGVPPTCTVAACDELDAVPPENGWRNGDDFSLGSVLNFTCNEGYTVHGEKSLRCLDSGQWSGPAPTCKHMCEHQNITCQEGERCSYVVNLGPKCVCRDNIECPAQYSPVCGSDGTTYNNYCIMKATACRQAKQIQQVKNGHCLPAGLCQINPISPCRGYFSVYWYNKDTKECENIVVGGCHSSGWNGFSDKRYCESTCLADVCASRMEPGPCTNNETRWAFDSTSGRCVKFKYGGCFGNENNFRTKQSCRKRCTNKGCCPRCPQVDLDSACQSSSFALQVQVKSALAPQITKRLLRYEAKIQKIFLDTTQTISEGNTIISVPYEGSSKCSCPRLPLRKTFLIVGKSPNGLITVTAKTGLTVGKDSYVRGWTNKVGAKLRKRCAAPQFTNLP